MGRYWGLAGQPVQPVSELQVRSCGESLRKMSSVDLWPPHTCTHVHTCGVSLFLVVLATSLRGQREQTSAGLCETCEDNRDRLLGFSFSQTAQRYARVRGICRMGTAEEASPNLLLAAWSYCTAGTQHLISMQRAEGEHLQGTVSKVKLKINQASNHRDCFQVRSDREQEACWEKGVFHLL